MAEAFGQEIPKLLVSGLDQSRLNLGYYISNTNSRDTLDVVKQSAALCLLKLFRTDASVIPSGEYLEVIFK